MTDETAMIRLDLGLALTVLSIQIISSNRKPAGEMEEEPSQITDEIMSDQHAKHLRKNRSEDR